MTGSAYSKIHSTGDTLSTNALRQYNLGPVKDMCNEGADETPVVGEVNGPEIGLNLSKYLV